MSGDERFVKPGDEEDKWWAEEEGFSFLYTARGSMLAERMIDRLCELAKKKFGDAALEIDIESHLFRER